MLNSMARYFMVIVSFIVFSTTVNAQTQKAVVYSIKQGADSVWILSHVVTGVFIHKDDGQSVERTLFKGDVLDSDLVRKTHLLSAEERVQLAALLSKPNTEMKTEMAKCFMPQHAIVWRKAGKVSWIEVCFSCQKLQEFSDLKMALARFDNPKWAALRLFFKQKGLTYEP